MAALTLEGSFCGRLVEKILRRPSSALGLSCLSYDCLGSRRFCLSYATRASISVSSHGLSEQRSDTNENPANIVSQRISVAEGKSSFYATTHSDWSSLQLHPILLASLTRNGFTRPAAVQASSFIPIVNRKDVIIGAQTGSGKTYAYLLPILQNLLQSQSSQQPELILSDVEDEEIGRPVKHSHEFALVLCPNATLCQQVAAMARSLLSSAETESGFALQVHSLAGGEGWPSQAPHLVVATVASLLNQLFRFDPQARRRSAFLRDVKYLVVDEADMLLSGGYGRQVGRLLGLMRAEEKEQDRRRKAAAVEGIEAEQRAWTQYSQLQEGEGAEDLSTVMAGTEEEAEDLTWADEEWESGPAGDGVDEKEEEVEFKGGDKKERRLREYLQKRRSYERSKQYIFVAATLPSAGKMSVAQLLKKQFPEAIWITGHNMHHNTDSLDQDWVKVSQEDRVPVLLETIRASLALPTPQRVLVFANTAASVQAIGRVLQREGVDCQVFHADLSLSERLVSLRELSQHGGVMVCTDAVGRGIDIPNVSHVVQAEFALSAVDYLHRVGRTARAGTAGRVTNLYTESSQLLVDAVRQAVQSGMPIEGAFSRKRSLRKKYKKLNVANSEN